MVKHSCISSVDFCDIFGRSTSLIFNFWAPQHQNLGKSPDHVQSSEFSNLKMKRQKNRNFAGQKVDLSFSCFYDDTLRYVLIIPIHDTRTLEVKHGLGDSPKILIYQNFDPMGVSRARKNIMKNLKISSSQNIGTSFQNNVPKRT